PPFKTGELAQGNGISGLDVEQGSQEVPAGDAGTAGGIALAVVADQERVENHRRTGIHPEPDIHGFGHRIRGKGFGGTAMEESRFAEGVQDPAPIPDHGFFFERPSRLRTQPAGHDDGGRSFRYGNLHPSETVSPAFADPDA